MPSLVVAQQLVCAPQHAVGWQVESTLLLLTRAAAADIPAAGDRCLLLHYC
jgi:hypothetical protein